VTLCPVLEEVVGFMNVAVNTAVMILSRFCGVTLDGFWILFGFMGQVSNTNFYLLFYSRSTHVRVLS
jgi:hypothetical protein